MPTDVCLVGASAKVLVLDYGVSGNGYLEQNAIDGANGINSPYHQIVSWVSHPRSTTPTQGSLIKTRIGQLRGLTGIDEWGIYAGTGWTATPNEGNVSQYSITTPAVDDTHRYIIAGERGVQIYNADLVMYTSTTPTLYVDRNAPFFALGYTSL